MIEQRELRIDDTEGLADLVTGVYDELPESMNFLYRPSRAELADMVSKKIGRILRKQLVDMVALEDGRVIADCEIAIDSSGRGIVGVIVSKSHRRKGVARSLLEECLRKSKDLGIDTVYAEVTKTNGPALAFFEKTGFLHLNDIVGKPGKRVLIRKI